MLPVPQVTPPKTTDDKLSSPDSLPQKVMRDWREQLNEVGVDNATIEYFGIHPVSGGYVAYSCQYPPRIDHATNQVKFDSVERGRLLPDALKLHPDKQRFFNPKLEETPNGEMPFFYTPDYNDLRQEVMADDGVLYGFEGDKDTWTAYAAGIKNSAGVLSAGARIDDRLALQLQEMGVKTFRYYPDADNAGWNLAERIADILSKYSISLQVFHLPFYVNEQRIKDTSDIWMAVKFDCGEYLKTISGLRQIKLASQQQRETSKDGDYFDKRLYEDIQSALGFVDADYRGNDGWPKRSVACIFNHHEHDDHHPSFAWNKTMHISRCFKCGETKLAKDVAQQLGINWRAYINREYANQPPPSSSDSNYDVRLAATPPKPIEQTATQDSGGVKGLQVDQSLLKSMNLATDYSQLPDSAFLYTLEDAIDDYEKRLLGAISSPYPPIMNPFKVLHQLGGLAHVLTPPVMVGILGASGGYKTTSLTTIMNTLSMQGYHGIVFSPEWTAQRNADRAVQQFGGLRLGEMSLYQRFLHEQEQIKRGKLTSTDPAVFGVAPPKSNMDNTFRALVAIRRKMRGKVIYINKFGASVFDVMAMVNEAAKRMADAGTPPSYLIFDYAQMAIAPRGFRDWGIGDTVNLVKSFTIQLGLATFMASQVRKTDSDNIKEGELLTSTSGLGLRDDFFNLFWTTNPTPEIYWNKDKTEQFKAIKIAVTKNSDGKLADTEGTALTLYAGLKRLVIVDNMDDPTYTMDIDIHDPDLVEAQSQ